MPIAVFLRRIVLVALLFLFQSFWFRRGWRLASRAPRPFLKWAGRAFLVLAAVAIALVLFDALSQRSLPRGLRYTIAAPVQLWIFTSILAFFGIQAVHFAGWLWSGVARLHARHRHASSYAPGRRNFVRRAASLVGALPFFPALYGFARERLHFQIVRLDVPLPNLPAALDGMRIVQLSDIHAGEFMPPDEIRRAVDMANNLNATLAVVTGDFITGWGDPLKDCIAELSRLRAPLGIWGCNGNHEIYAGAEQKAQDLFAGFCMTLLRQSAAQLRCNGQGFNLIGIDYISDWRAKSRPTSLASIDPLVRRDMPNILLSHNPNVFYRAAKSGIELTLSGHTHGGQINLEIVSPTLNPARFETEFVAGLYHLPKFGDQQTAARPATLYVNRGLGTLGVPARIGAEPEITLLTLRHA